MADGLSKRGTGGETKRISQLEQKKGAKGGPCAVAKQPGLQPRAAVSPSAGRPGIMSHAFAKLLAHTPGDEGDCRVFFFVFLLTFARWYNGAEQAEPFSRPSNAGSDKQEPITFLFALRTTVGTYLR